LGGLSTIVFHNVLSELESAIYIDKNKIFEKDFKRRGRRLYFKKSHEKSYEIGCTHEN
jgi:hypothetical protein